jgi:hypothetical protein
VPSTALFWSDAPTKKFATNPSTAPTTPSPTEETAVQPTDEPTDEPNVGEVEEILKTRFYAIGDVPYSDAETQGIEVQVKNLPADAEFRASVSGFETDYICE